MADGTQDRIDIALGADTSGLDAAERRAFSFLDRYEARVTQAARQLPPLDLDTGPLAQSLAKAGTSIGALFTQLRDLTATDADATLNELAQTLALTSLQFRANSDEARGFAAVIRDIRSAQQTLAETGDLPGFGGAAQGAAEIGTLAQGLIGQRDAAELAAVANEHLLSAMLREGQAARRAAGDNEAVAASFATLAGASRVPASSFDVLASGLQGQRTAALEAAEANARLRDVMLQEGQAARRASADNEAATAALGGLGGAATVVEQRTAGAGRGMNLLRGGAVALAAQSIGVSGSLGSISTGLLFLSGLAPEVVIALAAITIAMDKLGSANRKATEDADKLIDKLKQAAEARKPDFQQMADQIDDVRQKAEEATTRLRALQAEAALRGPLEGFLFHGKADEEFQRLQDFRDALEKLIPLQAQLQQQATSGKGTGLIADLGLQLATFGQSTTAIQKYRLALETGMTEPQRQAAGVLLDLIDKQEQHKKAMDEAARAAAKDGAVIRDVFADALSVVSDALAKIGADPFGDLVKKQQKATVDQLGLIAKPADGVQQQFDRAAGGADDIQRALLRAIAASDRFGERAIRNAEDTRTANERLFDSVDEVIQGLGGIVGAAANVGLIGDEATRSADQMLGLADALNKVVASASTANVLGVVGAGIGILGSLLGPSEAERERNRILQENNDLLQRNNAELANREGGVGGLSQQRELLATLAQEQALLQRVQNSGVPVDATGRSKAPFLDDARRELQNQLAGAGSNIQDFAAQIKDPTGISILDDKGRLVAATFQQAVEAINDLIAAATSFADTFEEQNQRTDIRSRLAGEPQDATSAFARELANATKLSPGVANAFAGVDPTDRAAVRDAVLKLFDQFDQGFFTAHPELLGKFTKDDILRLFEDSASFLDSFNDSLNAATRNLQNVPDIVTLAEQEFAARSPINRPGDGSSLPPFGGTDLNPRVPGVDFARFGAAQSITIHTLNVNVQGTADDPEATAKAIRDRFVRSMLATTGQEDIA